MDNTLRIKTENPFISVKKRAFSQKLMLSVIRNGFKILERITPSIAERMALHLFLTPPRYPLPKWHQSYLKSAKQSKVVVGNKIIQFYQWGRGPSVLLVHAWGGRGSQLSAFIDPLINAGYSVIAFDGPAHGDSTGKQTDMFEFAEAVHAVSNVAISLHAIIAHSFGAACTLLSLREHPFILSKLILIGCPASAIGVTEDFAKKLSISKRIVYGMRKQLEKKYNNRWTWEELSLVRMINNMTIPMLIVHDSDDNEIAYSQALELKRAASTAELFSTKGHGHRRILRASEVIDTCLKFLIKEIA
jgi:alpha/beta hydrolase family protein